MTCLVFGALSWIDVENQVQRAQQNDLKHCEYGQKGSTNKTLNCRDRAENSIAEKEESNGKDGLAGRGGKHL